MAGLCPPTAQELGAVLTPVTLPHLQAPRSRRLSQAPVLASSSRTSGRHLVISTASAPSGNCLFMPFCSLPTGLFSVQ